MERCAYVLFFLLFVVNINILSAHLCLFYPQQRGKLNYNIYFPFPTPECAHHGEPCGGIPPEKPVRTFIGGQQAYVKWQQNLNMYEIGYPGYMEISIAPLNSTNFEVLAVVQDQNTFGQFVRQNYSALVMVPNVDCEHCVLRARYNSHKPGEPVFVQCADVTVTSSSRSNGVEPSNFPPSISEYHELTKGLQLQYNYPVKRQKVEGLTLYGFAYNPYQENRVQYVKIDLESGVKEGITKYEFDIGFGRRGKITRDNLQNKHFQQNYDFIAESVLTVNNAKGQTTLLYHNTGSLDAPPSAILEINTQTGEIIRTKTITNLPSGRALNSIISTADGYLTFSIKEIQKNVYVFVIGKLNSDAVYQDFITTQTGEKDYVNFEWAELNTDNQMLYILMSKGNLSMYTFNDVPRMYIFDISKGTFVSFYNISARYDYFAGRSFHYYKKTGKLYAMTAPIYGLYKYADWNIVEVDPTNGNITMKNYVTDSAVFNPYGGGVIFSGIDQSRGVLYHVLRIADSEADIIAAVDIDTQKATFSKMTNLRHIHNLNLVLST